MSTSQLHPCVYRPKQRLIGLPLLKISQCVKSRSEGQAVLGLLELTVTQSQIKTAQCATYLHMNVLVQTYLILVPADCHEQNALCKLHVVKCVQISNYSTCYHACTRCFTEAVIHFFYLNRQLSVPKWSYTAMKAEQMTMSALPQPLTVGIVQRTQAPDQTDTSALLSCLISTFSTTSLLSQCSK